MERKGWPLVPTSAIVTSSGMGWFGLHPEPTLPALCWLTVTGVCLALVDMSCRRLPRLLVSAMGLGGLIGFVAAAVLESRLDSLTTAFLAAGAVSVTAIAVALAIPGQLGGGDVTLYPVLALYLGWYGWSTLILGVVAGALLTGGWATALLLTGRAGLSSRIPAGPTIILGAFVAIAFATETGTA